MKHEDDPIYQAMITLQYEPDELMVRYLEAVIYQRQHSTFADLHVAAANAHRVVGPLVENDFTQDKLLKWINEARRRLDWRSALQ